MAEQNEATIVTTPEGSSSENLSSMGGGDFLGKNQNTIITIVAVILVATLGFFGYKYYISEQDNTAQAEMFKAVFAFEADSLDKALKGSGGFPGLESIAEDYSGTPAAQQANYYCGIIYLKKGQYQKAIEHLDKVSFNDALVQARAYSLIGDAHLELKEYDQAISYYKKAAEYKPNRYFTPAYLMKLGLAQELNNDLSGALASYTTVVEKYGDQSDATDAKKYKAMLEEKLAAGK